METFVVVHATPITFWVTDRNHSLRQAVIVSRDVHGVVHAHVEPHREPMPLSEIEAASNDRVNARFDPPMDPQNTAGGVD